MTLLANYHIALTASRKTDEMEELIRKQGGTSSVRSMQGTVIEDETIVKAMIRDGLNANVDWFVFTTGIGIQTFMRHAEEMGVKKTFVDKLNKARIAVRGYKAIAALKKEGVSYEVASEDGTTKDLLVKLSAFPFQKKHVVVQLYGIPSPEMEQFFSVKQAVLTTWLPYHHLPPEESVADQLLRELVMAKSYQAVCFTSALQVKALFSCAENRGLTEEVIASFEDDVIATAVGKVTAEALYESGVTNVVYPAKERMGAMIIHLGKYIASTK
ncbi:MULTISPECIES: uroporphyrinogen-III synthase [Shouchella]|uniref:Uroporphyrinogen-III synthase n=2 Tax=Shouchella TaxID=2893057 RepID=A0ABY7W656_9BACI|nr:MULTISPECIES: uroporphyrinogen-III synthase [Shouchella]MED4130731.1 uroporphyrinogen-III synthase [Shouchella miscanthi]WDF02981.1 uroporphyrinogen-III synthase [Shouchella hunanensis]